MVATGRDDAAIRRPVVMADVARRAGVSQMTVSRVLDGSPRVAEATRIKVLEAVAALNYQRNPSARALAAGRSRLLGYAVFETTLRGPAETLHGFQESAWNAGFEVSVANFRSLDVEAVADSVRRLERQSVEGIALYAPHLSPDLVEHVIAPAVPTVLVNSGGQSSLPSLVFNQFEAASLAMRHLIDLGHRQIWHVGAPIDWLGQGMRSQAWEHVIQETPGASGRQLRGDWTARSGYENGMAIARQPEVSAVFVASDRMALGVLRALAESGRRVPEEVSVVGFDDIPESAYYSPPLTTVRQDGVFYGHVGFEMLMDAIDGRPATQELDLPAELVVRQSTAPAP